jgi:hypothetical protein
MRWFVLLCALLTTLPLRAEYDYPGTGFFVDVKGQKQSLSFGLALLKQSDSYLFRLGKQQVTVAESPKRFTLALVLNDQHQVWVPDFSNQPVTAFDWTLGNHRLVLQQDGISQLYILQVDQHRYQFTAKKRGQIHFMLTEKGITEIRVESMLKI